MKWTWKKTVGALVAVMMVSCVSAETIDVIFNRVRITVDSNTVTEWGQNIKDTELPSSITYRDTTYVPLRWLSDNMNKKVAWNGDSKTVSITDNDNPSSKVVTEKEDLNGNLWTYEIVTTDKQAYLVVSDAKRGFERWYGLASNDGYKFTDDGVYYVDKKSHSLYFMKFLNDENSQDGEKTGINTGYEFVFDFCFDGDYMIWAYNNVITTVPNGNIAIANIKTGKVNSVYNSGTINRLRVEKKDENTYEVYYNGKYSMHKVEINKNTLEFSEVKNVYRVGNSAYANELTLKNFDFLKKGMTSEEIFEKAGQGEITENGEILYSFCDGNDLYLRLDENKLSEVILKMQSGMKFSIPAEYYSGKFQIVPPRKQEVQ